MIVGKQLPCAWLRNLLWHAGLNSELSHILSETFDSAEESPLFNSHSLVEERCLLRIHALMHVHITSVFKMAAVMLMKKQSLVVGFLRYCSSVPALGTELQYLKSSWKLKLLNDKISYSEMIHHDTEEKSLSAVDHVYSHTLFPDIYGPSLSKRPW